MIKKVYFIIAVLFICLIALGVACTQKLAPVITSRKTEPLKRGKIIISVEPDMTEGQIIFTNRCGKCHDLPLPEQYTAKRWEGILSYMIPRARLDTAQGVHVSAYLKANAGK